MKTLEEIRKDVFESVHKGDYLKYDKKAFYAASGAKHLQIVCGGNILDTGTLDTAFERRFLYKIKFDKPTPQERQHIWKSMLPDLTEENALMLAKRFDFSGGQIENITRKRIISDILNECDTLDITSSSRVARTNCWARVQILLV